MLDSALLRRTDRRTDESSNWSRVRIHVRCCCGTVFHPHPYRGRRKEPMSIDETEFDSHSGLFTVYDAVHGAIDLRDPEGLTGLGGIIQLLSSPMVERLRRIKQLGYASHSYTAADHSRYAHAIGTMHMMKTILGHLIANKRINERVYKDLRSCFPEALPTNRKGEYQNT